MRLEFKLTVYVEGDAKVSPIMKNVMVGLRRQIEEVGLTATEDEGFVTRLTLDSPCEPQLEYKNGHVLRHM